MTEAHKGSVAFVKAARDTVALEWCDLSKPRTPSPGWLERRDMAYELKVAAQQLNVPPQYEAGNPVRCRGEELSSPIYWQGRQWAVTAFGIECRDGTYVIHKKPDLGKRGTIRLDHAHVRQGMDRPLRLRRSTAHCPSPLATVSP
jgi:hypothetical protein